MGRPAQTNCPVRTNHYIMLRRTSASLTSAKRRSMRWSPRMAACAVVLVWATLLVSGSFTLSSAARSSEADMDLDSDLVETETGWRFAADNEYDSIHAFDANATAPAAAPAQAHTISGRIPLADGDFETANMTGVTGNQLVTADGRIPNWSPGGAGVYVVQGYKMSSFDPTGKYAVHLNNPAGVNSTQGSISTVLSPVPAKGKTFTIQFDCARNPDGPANLLSAMKASSVSGSTVNKWELHHVVYNATDTNASVTWTRRSLVFTGTGVATNIVLASMSEMYGPLVDNVVMLSGSHPLSAAWSALSRLSLWQRVCPLFTAIAVVAGFHSRGLLSNLL